MPSAPSLSWPMPPPYPEAWSRNKPEFALGKPVFRGAAHSRQSYLNLLVTYLGFLALGEPTSAPPNARLGLDLSPSQRAAVGNLEVSTAWWLPGSSVAAEDLRRGTGRARTTLDAIARLSSAASSFNKTSEGGLGGN